MKATTIFIALLADACARSPVRGHPGIDGLNFHHVSEDDRLLTLEVEGERLLFNLERASPLFTDDAVLKLSSSLGEDTMKLDHDAQTFWMKPGNDNNWAVVTVLEDQKLQGVFTAKNGTRLLEFDHRLSSPPGRFLAVLPSFSAGGAGAGDEEPPCGTIGAAGPPAVPGPTNLVGAATGAGGGRIIPFFPGCPFEDTQRRELVMGIAVDASFFIAAGRSRLAVLREIETTMAATRLLYLAQLNILLTIGRVVIAEDAGADPPLYQGAPGGMPCNMNSMSLLEQFADWTDHEPEVGLWHLFTNCWVPPGVVGIAQVGSLCQNGRNVGVSTKSGPGGWTTFAHELGHGFGSSHSFENGMGRTGGIMDYGDPYYDGFIQFHPLKRSEICAHLLKATKLCSTSNLRIARDVGRPLCGNGLIDSDEEQCECLGVAMGGKTAASCPGCVNCRLTNKMQQCSTKDFIMRTTPTDKKSNEFIPVESSRLSSRECCTANGQLLDGNQNCNGADVCVFGECTRFCSKYGLQSCRTAEGGCVQPCSFKAGGACDSTLVTQTTKTKISLLPDGASCDKGKGECRSGRCESPGGDNVSQNNGSGMQPRPSSQPNNGTAAVVGLNKSIPPTTNPTLRCPFLNIEVCPTLGVGMCTKSPVWRYRCSFCNGKCRARTPNKCMDRDDFYSLCEKSLKNNTTAR